MLINRLKEVWPCIIATNQTSFVPGKQGIDHIIVCQEPIHSIMYSTSRKGGIVLKLDLKKAYDRLEWGYAEEILKEVGLPETTVAAIMGIITKRSCRLLWNSELTESIKPSRGLQQGDPLFFLTLFSA